MYAVEQQCYQLTSAGVGLLVPSETWLETVLALEVIFCATMGAAATRPRL